LRILIADDHALFRDGLRSLLEARGVDVVAEANNGHDAIRMASEFQPDIVLMDLNMPGMGGLDATRILSADLPDVKTVVLTASEEDDDLFEAIKAGAQGYLPKNLEASEFFELLDRVTRGEPAFTPGVARKVLREFAKPPAPRPAKDAQTLTEREQQVLELLVSGITSNRELASKLVVSENTVKYHLRNILDKLHVQNRAQVIAYAVREGLVSPRDPDR
jgi:DNA-binding NarL/FixJ family response regulator